MCHVGDKWFTFLQNQPGSWVQYLKRMLKKAGFKVVYHPDTFCHKPAFYQYFLTAYIFLMRASTDLWKLQLVMQVGYKCLSGFGSNAHPPKVWEKSEAGFW